MTLSINSVKDRLFMGGSVCCFENNINLVSFPGVGKKIRNSMDYLLKQEQENAKDNWN